MQQQAKAPRIESSFSPWEETMKFFIEPCVTDYSNKNPSLAHAEPSAEQIAKNEHKKE